MRIGGGIAAAAIAVLMLAGCSATSSGSGSRDSGVSNFGGSDSAVQPAPAPAGADDPAPAAPPAASGLDCAGIAAQVSGTPVAVGDVTTSNGLAGLPGDGCAFLTAPSQSGGPATYTVFYPTGAESSLASWAQGQGFQQLDPSPNPGFVTWAAMGGGTMLAYGPSGADGILQAVLQSF